MLIVRTDKLPLFHFLLSRKKRLRCGDKEKHFPLRNSEVLACGKMFEMCHIKLLFLFPNRLYMPVKMEVEHCVKLKTVLPFITTDEELTHPGHPNQSLFLSPSPNTTPPKKNLVLQWIFHTKSCRTVPRTSIHPSLSDPTDRGDLEIRSENSREMRLANRLN